MNTIQVVIPLLVKLNDLEDAKNRFSSDNILYEYKRTN